MCVPAGKTPSTNSGMIDLINMMKNRGGKGNPAGMPSGMPMGMPGGMPMGMRLGMPGQNTLFTPRPKMGGALPLIMKMRLLDAMGIENPILMMNMLGGGFGGLGAMSGMPSTPRGLGGMGSGMPGRGQMPMFGGAKRGGNRQPEQRTINNNKKPMWGKPNTAQAPPSSNSAYGFASMLNNPVAMSMFLSGNMPDSLQDMMQMNMAGNLLGGRGMGRGFGLRQLAALSFLEGISK